VPEGLEAEIWRRAVSVTIGRRVADVWVDARVAPPAFAERVTGLRIEDVRRAGKAVLIRTDGPTVGLHFGMTGRVVVDGDAPIERLEYASARDDPNWDRLRLWTGRQRAAIPAIRLNDPRRFGHVSLDPDISRLGPDMFVVTASELGRALSGRRAPIKTTLLDQAVVAGLGNLCVDEVLWWAGIDPHRPAGEVNPAELRVLVRTMRSRLAVMLRRGGSTTGTVSPAVRASLPACPRDGTPLRRDQVGGRTTVWCSSHQH
jgi:formamidopyrimidine-DNA glycosylase